MAHLHKRAKRGIAAVALFAAVVACGLAFLPRERLLMSEARKISAVGDARDTCRVWRTDHTFLQMSYLKDGDHFEFEEFDTDTGIKQPLAAVNDKWRVALRAKTFYNVPGSQKPLIEHNPPRFALSPNGQWILFPSNITNRDDAQPFTYVAAAVDCTKEVRWRSSSFWSSWNPPRWLCDNKRWLEPANTWNQNAMTSQPAAIVHNTQGPGSNVRITMPAGPWNPCLVLRGEHMLAVELNYGDPSVSTQIIDYGPVSSPAAPRKYAIRLPMPTSLLEVVPSSNGERLAWVFYYDDTPPLAIWLHRLTPFFRTHSRLTLGLWASAVDGAGMTEVGHKLLPKDAELENQLTDLQWVPGDKKLSFVHNDALYTVPVP